MDEVRRRWMETGFSMPEFAEMRGVELSDVSATMALSGNYQFLDEEAQKILKARADVGETFTLKNFALCEFRTYVRRQMTSGDLAAELFLFEVFTPISLYLECRESEVEHHGEMLTGMLNYQSKILGFQNDLHTDAIMGIFRAHRQIATELQKRILGRWRPHRQQRTAVAAPKMPRAKLVEKQYAISGFSETEREDTHTVVPLRSPIGGG